MKLTVALKVPFLVLKILFDCVSAALLGVVLRPKGWGYQRHVKYALLRSLAKYSLVTILANPRSSTTMDIYRAYMKVQTSEPEVLMLGAGVSGGWIGPSKAKRVLIFLHGGAYVYPAHPKHMEVMGELVETARDQGKDFSVFAVEYGLAPEAQYPLQMVQAANVLNYLIETVGYDPENIFVAGDSAGGNLAIALISLLSHPHPAVPKINLQGKKLAGCFLFSPWVTFNQNAASMKSNANKDFLNRRSLKASSLLFLGNAKVDSYNVPLSAPPEWWQDLRVHDLCIVGGEYEIFLDDIEAWTEKVKVYNPQTEYYLAPAEIHVQSATDRALRLEMAKSEEYFRNWILKRL